MTTACDDPRRWWALAALGLAVLTLGFDITIMNVALPTIATELESARTPCNGWSTPTSW